MRTVFSLRRSWSQRRIRPDLALIGPNCMGIYHPKIGLRNYTELPTGEAGTVGFIGQSGTHTITFSLAAPQHGNKISKAVSFGNAVVLDASDYLRLSGSRCRNPNHRHVPRRRPRGAPVFLTAARGDQAQAGCHLERRPKSGWPASNLFAYRFTRHFVCNLECYGQAGRGNPSGQFR